MCADAIGATQRTMANTAPTNAANFFVELTFTQPPQEMTRAALQRI